MTAPVRVAAVNAPRPSARKPYVGTPRLQAARLTRVLSGAGVDVASVAEMYPALDDRLDTYPAWGVFRATPNRGGPGNALVHHRGSVRRTDAHDVDVDYRRYRDGLHMAQARYGHGADGWSLPVTALHLPIRRDASDAEWRRILDQVLEQVDGRAAVLAGDFNRGASIVDRVLGRRWELAATDGQVMHVFARGCTVHRRGDVSRGYRRAVSDHPAMPWADLTPDHHTRKARR